ncbi:pimeloyl-ACP methyl ester carboxylesterase [Diaminobutyricimonas aerilata]|uniref:Pimeloyl-ACP methyl ester carboxylesterase n=1 Tax=Diaminobutyricimonas aerilata TaxID=1162967 RepID=A0A2M9CNW0_9MICO|nr:alpha/beta hydrolase [Diaminobutyricimonas aerilata]PJJ73564.1 pimeloyl-ACP methyl ester carboxylesterase [Diaminobutyricimonas aerilata]
MPHLDVDGASLYYETAGDPAAPALLLIHAGIANLRMWDPIVPALAADHHVIRFDTRGFGQTATQNVGFSDRADALSVLDALDVHKATVIGASRGGGIAIDLALESPGRVRGLVTVGSGPSGFPELDMTDREDELFDEIDVAFEARDWERMLRLEAAVWDFGPERDPATLDPAFVETAYALNLANLPHVEENPTPVRLDPPAYDRLSDITVPALVIVGEYDLSPVLAESEFLASNLPDADTVRFRNAAHLPSVEHPGEFTRVVRDWLGQRGL